MPSERWVTFSRPRNHSRMWDVGGFKPACLQTALTLCQAAEVLTNDNLAGTDQLAFRYA
jgi:hypothetical protein